jgi:hypothetical protein
MGEKLISMLAAARLWGVAPKTVREWRLKGYLVRRAMAASTSSAARRSSSNAHTVTVAALAADHLRRCRPVPLVCFDRCARRVRGIVIVS